MLEWSRPVPAGAWPGKKSTMIVCKAESWLEMTVESTWRFLRVARQAATLGLWHAIPRVGELPFLKGFSLWTNQSERVYFYWPPGPNPVVTISTRVGPGSRLHDCWLVSEERRCRWELPRPRVCAGRLTASQCVTSSSPLFRASSALALLDRVPQWCEERHCAGVFY